MASINLNFYNGEDEYSDGNVENKLLEIVKSKKDYQDVISKENEYAIVYHLSHLRENILNWYTFNKDCSILEIGSGCGALTGLLCRKAKKVKSVELTKRRAEINYNRNLDKDNLEILVGNFENMLFDEKFDYIILNGVFEYAISFIKGDNPYSKLLEKLKKLLTLNGILLIAIENRLGLKYFNGSREDHTGMFFEGINEYKNTNYARTFSKYELGLLFDKAKMQYRYYYPYPDYKFPNEIFTDDSINVINSSQVYFPMDANRVSFFDEKQINHTFIKENIADIFANSFLIELSQNDSFATPIPYYVKISANRKESLRILTKIEKKGNNLIVKKKAITKKGALHVENLINNTDMINNSRTLKHLKGQKNGKTIEYPFLKGITLENTLLELANKKDERKFFDLLDFFYNNLKIDVTNISNSDCQDFEKVFGNHHIEILSNSPCLCPANVDLMFDNIFVEHNEFIVVDPEWVFNFPVPFDFIFWRGLNELYSRNFNVMNLFMDKNSLFDRYGINQQMTEKFTDWILFFSKNYIGISDYGNFKKYSYSLNLDDIVNSKSNNFMTTLYFDIDNGINEFDAIHLAVEAYENGEFKARYDIPQGIKIKNLRWDPIENLGISCQIIEISSNKSIIAKPINSSFKKDGKDIFLVNDPIYELLGEFDGLTYIEVNGYINILSTSEILDNVENQKVIMVTEMHRLRDYSEEILEYYKTKIAEVSLDYQEKESIIIEKEKEFRLLEQKYKEESLKIQHLETYIANMVKMNEQKDQENTKKIESLEYDISNFNKFPLKSAGRILYNKLKRKD